MEMNRGPERNELVVAAQIADALTRIANHLDASGEVASVPTPALESIFSGKNGASGKSVRKPSPYLQSQEAADYLGITVKSLYGLVERQQIVPLRGPKRTYRFTTDILDDYIWRHERKKPRKN